MKYSPWTLLTCAVVLTFLTTTSSTSPRRRRHTTTEMGENIDGANNNDNGRILDITHQYRPNMPSFGSKMGLGQILRLTNDMKNNSKTNNSELKMYVHSGTHVDAPSHVYEQYFEAGYDVDSLDLGVLNGPVMLVDVPRDSNITADVMKSLNITKGVRRVLFRTLNTDRHLMRKKEFDSSYVGFMEDGAKWLVKNTDIKLVGIDYLSIAAYDNLISTHLTLLKNRVTCWKDLFLELTTTPWLVCCRELGNSV